MMALLRASLLFLRTHFARVLLSRRMLLCALMALGPAVIAALVLSSRGETPPPVEVIAFPGWILLLQVVVPAASLIAGSAVISEEVEDRTITFLFTRPFPRAALLLGRWGATALILALLLGASALLLAASAEAFAPAGAPPIPHGELTVPLAAMAAAGGVVYSALFAVIGVFLKRPMIVGLAYTFVIEGFLANLPGKSKGLTVIYHLRSYVASCSETVWSEVLEEFRIALEPQSASLTWLAVVLVAALALGSYGVSRRQFELTA
jgi:ABC-type transport system involved in multi-copper enzyme maturation permease subunit